MQQRTKAECVIDMNRNRHETRHPRQTSIRVLPRINASREHRLFRADQDPGLHRTRRTQHAHSLGWTHAEKKLRDCDQTCVICLWVRVPK